LHHPANDEDRKRWLNDHSAPAFTVRPAGRIVAMYSLHGLGNTLYYRISNVAGSVTPWTGKREFSPASNSKVTFPNLHFLSSENGGEGRLYAFFRGIDQRQLPSWAYSDNLGETWVPGASFIEIPDKPKIIPYVKYCSNGSDTVHIAFTSGHHLDYGNALYHFYYRGGELFRSDGKPIHTLRVGLKSADEATCIFRANRGSVVWVSDVHMDRAGLRISRSAGSVQFRSRNGNDFSVRYPAIVNAVASLPSETVIDGEVVALDESGRPSFNILQNYGSSKSPILYYVFDALVFGGRDVMGMPLSVRLWPAAASSFTDEY